MLSIINALRVPDLSAVTDAETLFSSGNRMVLLAASQFKQGKTYGCVFARWPSILTDLVTGRL
jgi:hypothetical protein